MMHRQYTCCEVGVLLSWDVIREYQHRHDVSVAVLKTSSIPHALPRTATAHRITEVQQAFCIVISYCSTETQRMSGQPAPISFINQLGTDRHVTTTAGLHPGNGIHDARLISHATLS